jgi:S-DNA-T family DNA segregation ATPase FtsK/SpoIIIE
MPARKSSRKQLPSKRDKAPGQPLLPVSLDRGLQQEILGVLLLSVGGVTALALLSVTRGALSELWVLFLRRIFGWGVYLVVIALLAGGLVLIWDDLRKRISIEGRRTFGFEVLFLALLGLSHLMVAPEQGYALAQRGGGGGYIGWALSYFLADALGRPVAVLVFLPVAALGLFLLWTADWTKLQRVWEKAAGRLRRQISPSQRWGGVSASEAREGLSDLPPKKGGHRRKAPDLTESERQEAKTPAPARSRRRRLHRGLPPLDLLNGGADEPHGEADVRYKKQVIEETLSSFGVPVEVVEVNQGPTITQFGVEPGFLEYRRGDGTVGRRKVKVSKIMSLQDDLALALAASPIRIEAPVPGRSVVGIEVPNDKVSLVGLRSVIESKAFRDIDSRLRVALGRDVSGQPVAADLGLMPHLLIAGATGSGKSVCINANIACLLLNNTPETLKLVMIDPKMVELTNFSGVPHLAGPVVTTAEEAVHALRWVTAQMDERYHLFSDAGTRHIEAYNRLAASREQDQLPYIVVLIDELADLMMVAPDEIERSICRIAQLARATGIHLVIATQRPSVDVVTGLIKANFPARISFAVTTQVDSRVILDTAGAEKLLGRGDLLYMSSDSSKLLRMQGCFVSDEELERIVHYWRDKVDWMVAEPAVPSPWHALAEAEEDDEDELLSRAIELARGRDNISVSYLQRRLRIGYPRAARLVDLMEERGVVGPAANAGRSRDVLDEDLELEDASGEPSEL